MESIRLRVCGNTWMRLALWLTLLMAFGPGVPRASGATAFEGAALPGPAVEPSTSVISSSLERPMFIRPAMAPRPRLEQPTFADRALYVGIAAYRTMDLVSTQHAIAWGAREVVLPQWVVANTAVFAGFEGLSTVGEVGASVWLIHHRHRRMARALNMMSISLGTNTVLHNYKQNLWSPVTAGR